MTYPAPPPPPQTTPAPQVVVQTPSAVAHPEPAAPPPLRQVIEQLPPPKAADLGRPIGVVDISTVRESVQGSAQHSTGDRPTSPQNSAAQALPNSVPTLPPLSNPAAASASSPNASLASTSSAENNSNTPSSDSLRGAPGSDLNSAAADRTVDGSDRPPVPSSSPERLDNTPDQRQGIAQNSAQSIDRRSPFNSDPLNSDPLTPSPINPAAEPIPPALPPTNRTPTTREEQW